MSVMKKILSRRKFLKAAGAGGVGAFMTCMHFQKTLRAAAQPSDETIPFRPFGRTGVTVPMLGFGGSQSLESKQRLLRQAVKLGVTYWDTAESYSNGGSEKAMGKYLQKYPGDRKKLFLVTKSHAVQPSRLSQSLDNSLKRLNSTFIDLFLIHGISSPYEMDKGIRNWAEHAKSDGKIRFIGFSSHSNMEACMTEAAKLGWIDGIMVTYNYRLMHTDAMKRAVEACIKAGIGLTAMKAQAGRSWGDVGRNTETVKQLIDAFSKKGFTEEQAKLMAVWDNPHIATICSEMTNLEMLTKNVAAAQKRNGPSLGDKQLLKQYARETMSEYCAGCADICGSALEAEVPVCDIMRYLMYARCYQEPERAKSLFHELVPAIHRRMGEIDYLAAETSCPRGMPIGRLMEEAIAELL